VRAAPLAAAVELLQAPGELVAQPLELLEGEQPGPARALARCGHRRDVRKAAGDDRRQLALEPRHLCPQRAPRGALADLGPLKSAAIED
jgi:hypothetical protein